LGEDSYPLEYESINVVFSFIDPLVLLISL